MAWRETDASIGLSWVGTAYLDGHPALLSLPSETVRAFCTPNSPYTSLLETDQKNRNENFHKAPFFVSLDTTWLTACLSVFSLTRLPSMKFSHSYSHSELYKSYYVLLAKSSHWVLFKCMYFETMPLSLH